MLQGQEQKRRLGMSHACSANMFLRLGRCNMMQYHCRCGRMWTTGPSPSVLPVDIKHRGSWLMTLNSARSWQMTSQNSAENNSFIYAARSVRAPWQLVSDCAIHFRTCVKYRRAAYARACIGTNTVLTRWQEWCVPFLSDTRTESAASIMNLVELHIASFLNDDRAIHRAVSRTAAGYQTNACTCSSRDQNPLQSNCIVVNHKQAPDLGPETTRNHRIDHKFPRKIVTTARAKSPRKTPYKVETRDAGKRAESPIQEDTQWRTNRNEILNSRQKPRQGILNDGKPSCSKACARGPAEFLTASRMTCESGTDSVQVKTQKLLQNAGSADIATRSVGLSQGIRLDKDFAAAATRMDAIGVPCRHKESLSTDALRFQGGGAEMMTCFICQTERPAYIPKQLADEYVARCRTCGRGACNLHGKWELRCFHCAICDGNDDTIIACAKETLVLQCLSTAFQQQSLLYVTDGALLDFTLTLAAYRNKASERKLPFDPHDFVAALCLSYLHDSGLVDKLFAQDWVPTWAVWKDIGPDTTNTELEVVAQSFMQIAFEQLPRNQKTDAERLDELQASGLQRRSANHHGVNNCLIDAMLLTLAASKIVPGGLDKKRRRQLCAACRYHLWQTYGTPSGIYLDAHRDAPRILAFFLERIWNRSVAVRVHLYDRFDHGDLQLLDAHRVDSLDYAHPQRKEGEVHNVHIYNHTDACGHGYHFDALLPLRRDVAAAVPDLQQNACSAPIQVEQNPTNSHGDFFPGWAIQTGHLAGTVLSLLEALLQNLCFHGFLHMRKIDVNQWQDLCQACQIELEKPAGLENISVEGLEIDAWLQRYAPQAIMFFVTHAEAGSSIIDVEVAVYAAASTSLDTPVKQCHIHVGRSPIIAPVFRIYQKSDGTYAALLPSPATKTCQRCSRLTPHHSVLQSADAPDRLRQRNPNPVRRRRNVSQQLSRPQNSCGPKKNRRCQPQLKRRSQKSRNGRCWIPGPKRHQVSWRNSAPLYSDFAIQKTFNYKSRKQMRRHYMPRGIIWKIRLYFCTLSFRPAWNMQTEGCIMHAVWCTNGVRFIRSATKEAHNASAAIRSHHVTETAQKKRDAPRPPFETPSGGAPNPAPLVRASNQHLKER